MPVDPAAAQGEGGEAHPHLEGDAGLLGQDGDRPVALGQLDQPPEDRHHLGVPAGQVPVEVEGPAGVRLVAVGEGPPAARAGPHRCRVHQSVASTIRRREGAIMTQLWKGETEKAIEHFPISGERVPVEVVRMLARVKAEAARVNADLGPAGRRPGRADRGRRRGGRGRRARRPVPDRRVPDRVRAPTPTPTSTRSSPPWPARTSTPTTTSTWASPPTTPSRPRSTWPPWTRPPTTCCRPSTPWPGRWRPRRPSSATWSSPGAPT